MSFLISFSIEWLIEILDLHMGLVFLTLTLTLALADTISSLILTILPTKWSIFLTICISIFLISKNFSCTNLFVILTSHTSSHLIYKILLMHLIWNTSNFFNKFFVIVQLSHLQRRIFNDTAMKILYLSCSSTESVFPKKFRAPIAWFDFLILCRISYSSHRLYAIHEPTYLNILLKVIKLTDWTIILSVSTAFA